MVYSKEVGWPLKGLVVVTHGVDRATTQFLPNAVRVKPVQKHKKIKKTLRAEPRSFVIFKAK